MGKKKIVTIVLSITFLIIIGLGFNFIFSKSKEEANKTKVESSKDREQYKIYLDDDKKENKTTDIDDTKTSENKDAVEDKEEDKEVTTNTENINKDQKTTEQSDNSKNTENNQVAPNNNDTNKTNKPKETQTNPEPPKKDTVTIAISCDTAINNGVNKQEGFTHLPSDGKILQTKTVEIKQGDTVFDILQRTVRENKIHMEYTGSTSTIYIEGIDNLYEFDGGQNSGWMYSVNGWYPNYGCGVYNLKPNDVIKWNYTCDLGNDLGANIR